MTESKVVRIPLSKEMYDELDDAFMDSKDMTPDKFIFSKLKEMCRDAKAGVLNKSCSINVVRDGAPVQDSIKLSEINLDEYALESNPQWVPENLEGDSDVMFWEHKVTGKTWDYLQIAVKMDGFRYVKYNESVDKMASDTIEKLKRNIEGETDPEKVKNLQLELEANEKHEADMQSEREKHKPKCFEESIYQRVYPAIHQTVMRNLDVEFDKEFEAEYPVDAKKGQDPKHPPTPPLPGSRTAPSGR